MAVLAWALVGSLWAAAPVKSAPSFSDAQKAFDDGDFEAALRLADGAETAVTDDHQRAQIELFKGLCRSATGDLGGSSESFRAALRLDPSITLDPKTTAPDLIERLEGIRSTLRGELLVSTSEPGAPIRVDGHDAGPSPYRAQLTPGLHEVEALSLRGGASVKKTASVRPNGTTELFIDLAEASPSSSLSASTSSVQSVPSSVEAPSAPTLMPVKEVEAPAGVEKRPSLVPEVLTGVGAGAVVVGAIGIGYGVDVNTTAHGDASSGRPQTVSKAQFDTAGALYYTGWAMGAVGLVTAAYGVWGLVWPDALPIAMAPTNGGAVVAWGGSL